LTDWKPIFENLSWFVLAPPSPDNGLMKDSGAFQVKSVAESRFVQKLGMVTDTQLDEISSAVALCVGAP
jgi:mRNA interferase MazF